ncbi:SRPBCC family protein [Pseudarthrobacter sp. P1]|uniref:SRPBCC family protein n=1 Tax=Pseudarthrobacter sp. P1 TaxID=3418418 RepID=UPI003CF0C8F6
MRGRLFDLHSIWTLPASQQDVWDIIADPDMGWPAWWPHCTFAKPLARQQPHDDTPSGILLATTATLDFKSSLGYTLTVSIHPTRADAPHTLEFDASGHLEGTGRVLLGPATDGGTEMGIEWRVHPTQGWMVALTPLAAPAFTGAHDHLMREGQLGLRAALSRAG